MRASRVVLVLMVLAAVVSVDVGRSPRPPVPATLTDRRPVTEDAVRPGFPIGYLGLTWKQPEGIGASRLASPLVRFLRGEEWGPWQPLRAEELRAPGQWASRLVPGAGADAYQLREVPPDADEPEAVAINTSDGAPSAQPRRQTPAALAVGRCLSREDWGADESMRQDGAGREIWPPTFYPLQAIIVHHSDNQNGMDDPAYSIRAMQHYHAQELGWGDIGYNVIIDDAGRLYEGRWSGKRSRSCLREGGDGSDFGLDGEGRVVTGGHTEEYNEGTFGIALLGTFDDIAPSPAAMQTLEDLLTTLTGQHGLDPRGVVAYRNPNPEKKTENTADVISGHRDWSADDCPGELAYQLLPQLRDRVASRLRS